ncbi:MAG: DUF4105 domain-containing protein [Chitinophagaceae bacterium]|nr:DUF4105 domain-containing protein [Oligoflexus sp.]
MHTTYLKSLKTPLGVLFTLTALMIGSLPLSTSVSANGSVARMSWRRLLYYSSRTLEHDTSLVDSPEFFLARDGQSNSDHELDAFIQAIHDDSDAKPEQERIACRFPARTLWLKRNRPDIKLPSVTCPEFTNWLTLSRPKAVSLIFSSYFVNNPSSMEGHTFLRLRRGSAEAAPLLDKAVNFAAEPTTQIPLLYSIMGLTGSFPGKFALMPYYSKVQEYANAESRDLWEYNLNFNEQETLAMMASLWELAPTRIDYYFFDENCSAVLIYLLQSARPELSLADKLGFFVHPSDTLHIVMEEPNLVTDVVFRASTRSRYLAQKALLSEDEARLIPLMVAAKNEQVDGYGGISGPRKALLLDTILAFIEYDESLYGSKAPVKNAVLYDKVLSARSKLNAAPVTIFPPPPDEAPHEGHKGQRFGVGFGQFHRKYEGLLEYRPGPHDILSPAIGYPPELGIELGRTRLALVESGKAVIRSAELFHILSLNPSRSGRFPWSWQMQLNYENTEIKTVNLRSSIGQAFTLDERDHYVFGFFDTRVMEERGNPGICPGASLGARWSFGKRLVTIAEAGVERCYQDVTSPWVGLWTHAWRWSLNDTWEIYAEAQKRNASREWSAGFFRYF